MRATAILLVLVCAAGCGGKKSSGASAGAPAEAGPYAAFADPQALARLEGVWVVKEAMLADHPAVWAIHGTQVTVWDGKEESQQQLTVESPCMLGLTSKGAAGSLENFATFVWEGGTLHLGLGNAGLRRGSSVLVCGSATYLYQDGKCETLAQDLMHPSQIERKPTTCTIKKEEEGEVFEAVDPRFSGSPPDRLRIQGDILLGDQMRGDVAEKVADLAAGKARLAELMK